MAYRKRSVSRGRSTSRSYSVSSRSSRSYSSSYSRRRRRSRSRSSRSSYSSRSYSSYSSRSYSSYSRSRSPKRIVEKPSLWLEVENLSRSTTEAHLKEIVEYFGRTRSVEIPYSQSSFQNGWMPLHKGCAYVEMNSMEELEDVLDGLNGGVIDGKTISIVKSKSGPYPKPSMDSRGGEYERKKVVPPSNTRSPDYYGRERRDRRMESFDKRDSFRDSYSSSRQEYRRDSYQRMDYRRDYQRR